MANSRKLVRLLGFPQVLVKQNSNEMLRPTIADNQTFPDIAGGRTDSSTQNQQWIIFYYYYRVLKLLRHFLFSVAIP